MLRFLIITLFVVFKTSLLAAEIINDIKVIGNDRVSKSTIINFSDLKKGDDVSLTIINDSLKSLYDTNFFENVSIDISNNIVTIDVKEYPVIPSPKTPIFFSLKFFRNIIYLNFNVAMPRAARITAIIQNLMTICDSDHPNFSKW